MIALHSSAGTGFRGERSAAPIPPGASAAAFGLDDVFRSWPAGLFLARLGGRLSGLEALARAHEKLPSIHTLHDFARLALAELGIGWRVASGSAVDVPGEGPLVVVANHPFGGVEGLVLAELVGRRRGDLRILGNLLLARIPELRPHVIAVDPYDGARNVLGNAAPMREAVRWLGKGGALLVFPAGEVARGPLFGGEPEDRAWRRHVGSLVRRARAAVLPACFEGGNGLAFRLAARVHPSLGTAMLPRELLNKRGREIAVHLGPVLAWSRLAGCPDDRELTDRLRAHAMLLRHRGEPRRTAPAAPRRADPVAPPGDPAAVAAEIATLPEVQTLCRARAFRCVLARAGQIPATLREIGRLREAAFRQVGEGTGRHLDLDVFDDHYEHLVLWDTEGGRVAGAYRIGRCADILRERGVAGLYTSTLFQYGPGFLSGLDDALEIGRSFVCPEYQRHSGGLSLLWKGIGALVARDPLCRRLFGPVSISADYREVSRHLIVEFLSRTSHDGALAACVRPRRPVRFRGRPPEVAGLRDFEDVSLVVSGIEEDGKGIPTLLKHYLKLNAHLVCCNLDRDFADAIDGLIMVDLRRTDPRLLRHFMGDDGFLRFQERCGGFRSCAASPSPA